MIWNQENCKGIENCARWAKASGDEYVSVSDVLQSDRKQTNKKSLDWRTSNVLTAVKDQVMTELGRRSAGAMKMYAVNASA